MRLGQLKDIVAVLQIRYFVKDPGNFCMCIFNCKKM